MNNIGYQKKIIILVFITVFCFVALIISTPSAAEVLNQYSKTNLNSDSGLEKTNITEDISHLVTDIATWKHGIRHAVWNKSFYYNAFTFNEDGKFGSYNEHWESLLTMLGLTHCNIVDIGANDGDTTLNLAVASQGGSVVAFEMGPQVQVLRYNVKLNPQLSIYTHNAAVSNKTGWVHYDSDIMKGGCNCKGCCGGIAGDKKSSGPAVQAVQLVPFLRAHYSAQFLANIGMVKIDAEEHDTFILQDLVQHTDFRPPVIWTEWSSRFKIDRNDMVFEAEDYCTPESLKLFIAAIELGYDIFEPKLPLRKVHGCANKHYQPDLLLIHQNFLHQWSEENKINIPTLEKPYEVQLLTIKNYVLEDYSNLQYAVEDM